MLPYTHKRAVAIFLLLVTSIFAYKATGARRALVIGIGTYLDKSWGKIHGDNDVPLVKEMLKKSGYTDITTLTNSRATKQNIVKSLANLANKCKPGDVVYVHFSGHGQRVTDLNGDEEDGWDEAWVPYDAPKHYAPGYRGQLHMIDDEVGEFMTLIHRKTGERGRILLVVDACHSGDSSRGADDENVARGTVLDMCIPMQTHPAPQKRIPEQWITLTACRDYQRNFEVRTSDGNYFGKLTFALKNLHEGFRGLNNSEIAKRINCFMERYRGTFPQNPTITGTVQSHPLSEFFR